MWGALDGRRPLLGSMAKSKPERAVSVVTGTGKWPGPRPGAAGPALPVVVKARERQPAEVIRVQKRAFAPAAGLACDLLDSGRNLPGTETGSGPS